MGNYLGRTNTQPSTLAQWISSNDSSVTVTPPSTPGDGWNLQDGITFSSTSTITETTIPSAPPSRNLSVPSTAFAASTDPTQIPVGVTYNSPSAGLFSLNFDLSTSLTIPNTVIVGGKLGSMPSATTIALAISTYSAQLATATYSSPWTLLVAPGTDSSTFTLPPNVHVIALVQHSVILTGQLSMADTSANNGSTILSGLILQLSGGTIQTSGKTGGTYRVIVRNCEISASSTASLTVSMRPISASATAVDFYTDSLEIYNTMFFNASIPSLVLQGGMTNIRSCMVKGGILLAQAATGIGRLQIRDSTFGPQGSLTTQAGAWSVVRNCALGGIHAIGSAATSATAATTTHVIDTCEVNDSNVGGAAILSQHQLVATQAPGGATPTSVYIVDTNYPSSLIRSAVGSTAWSITQPNIPFTATTASAMQGLVDRPARATLLSPPGNTLTLTTYTVDYAPVPGSSSIIPYVNNTATTAAPPVPPYTVTQVTTCMTSSATRSLVRDTSTTSQLGLAALVASGDRLAIDLVPPVRSGVNWYD
jgi:hypothetical protein